MKMELKIKDDVFYVLETSEEKSLFDTESDAVGKLKDAVAKNPELDSENVSIIEVNMQGEKWEMKTIPWSKIAMELLRSGK